MINMWIFLPHDFFGHKQLILFGDTKPTCLPESRGIFVYTGEADIFCKHVPWTTTETPELDSSVMNRFPPVLFFFSTKPANVYS